jgi:hypothetical protein
VDYAKFEDNNPCIPHIEAQPLLFQNDGFLWAKSYTTNVDFFERHAGDPERNRTV